MSLLDAGGSACCGDCSATKCDAAKELARSVLPASSIIPPWLQQCRNQEPSHCKKWSSTGGESPSHHRTALHFSTVVSPCSSVSSYEQHYHPHKPYQQQPWPVADAHEAKHKQYPWKAQCGGGGGQVHVVVDDEDVKLVSAIKVKSHDSSASNGSVEQVECRSRFKELSAENLKVLCSALEKEVPWQAEIVPEIASTVLQCRSGMAARRRDAAEVSSSRAAASKEDTWLLFLGGDAEGKARVARELARLVFGSRKCFVSVGTTAPSPARSDSVEQRHKRPRLAEASNNGCVEGLYEAVRDNTHRVILVEDVEQAGQRGILEAIERGSVRSHGGEEAALGEAIVVLSCESFDARSRTSSPPTTKKAKAEIEEEPKEEAIVTAGSPSSSCLDLNLNMSLENDDMEESCCTDAGLLKAVDRAFFFRRPDESSD